MVVVGLVLGISRNVVTPPLAQALEAVNKVFLVRQSRFAKVHLIVDHAGQKMQAARINDLVRHPIRRRIHAYDRAVLDRHRNCGNLVGQHHLSIANQ